MNPQHSSESNEHYTPTFIVEAARNLMGGITLDPATCPEAQLTVKAEMFFSPEPSLVPGKCLGADGLHGPWPRGAKVFLNPPGGKIGKESSAAVWWNHLARLWENYEIEQAIFVGFTLELLRSAQGKGYPYPQNFPRCYPTQRLRFLKPGGEIGDKPTHANVIMWLPPSGARFESFQRAFLGVGLCESGGLDLPQESLRLLWE